LYLVGRIEDILYFGFSELFAMNMSIPVAVDPVSPAEVASVVDSALCKLKSLLKELLGRVS
jgi:hypothetical protein